MQWSRDFVDLHTYATIVVFSVREKIARPEEFPCYFPLFSCLHKGNAHSWYILLGKTEHAAEKRGLVKVVIQSVSVYLAG